MGLYGIYKLYKSYVTTRCDIILPWTIFFFYYISNDTHWGFCRQTRHRDPKVRPFSRSGKAKAPKGHRVQCSFTQLCKEEARKRHHNYCSPLKHKYDPRVKVSQTLMCHLDIIIVRYMRLVWFCNDDFIVINEIMPVDSQLNTR
jgi:hypothetical protein